MYLQRGKLTAKCKWTSHLPSGITVKNTLTVDNRRNKLCVQ